MNFFHCTTTKSARILLKPKNKKKVKPSYFNFVDCLNDWLRRLLNGNDDDIPSEDFSFPRYYYSQGDNKLVFWLGSGLYCFAESAKEESPAYAKKSNLDVILTINYKDDFTEFKMHQNKEMLQDFLSEVALPYYRQYYSDDLLTAFELLIELLVLEIETEYFTNPHSAAIILEMYLFITNTDYDIVSNKFLKDENNFKYDNYSSIRNLDSIINFEYNTGLSHEIRA
ncbi:hypothetical protein [Terribacillus saccharophilus]|uniref:hypothetical protein n=1 Tax=Terribacillus saccharophilus TaxID=361277 RepID=UPI000C9C8A20|nr:hypothetical protein [Terribacillus goriensis]